jgi:nitroreductase
MSAESRSISAAVPTKATKVTGATKGSGAAKTGKPRPADVASSHPAGESSKPGDRPKQSSGPSAATPLEIVRPLIRVRQMREFTGKRVTNAELEAITEVARWSGSSRNEQSCRFITLRDSSVIGQIAELGLPQTRGLRTAPVAVAIVEPDEPERGLSRAFDNGRAAERMLIAASMLGLGGGISRVRGDVRDGINELLDLPAHRSVRTIVAIGHPTDEALAPKSRPGTARLPREQVIFDGCWPGPGRDSHR